MTKSKNLGLNLPSRDNTTDLADINVISENFEAIDNEFGNVYNKLNNTGVVNTASGSPIVLKDSAKAPLANLKLYGETTQNGTPTPSAPVPLVSVGDGGNFEVNLFGENLIEYPYHNGASYTLNNITYTADENGIITVNGTSTSTSIYYLMNNKKIKATETIYIKNVNGYQNVGLICCYNLNGKDYYTGTSIPKGAIWKTCYLEVKSGATLNNVIVKPTASIGEVATEYEPPKAKQTLTMPYCLRGVGDIKDEIDFARGVLIKRCYLATDFERYMSKENVDVYKASKPYPLVYNIGICSHTSVYASGDTDDTHFYIGGGSIWVYIPKDADVSNLQVLCKLETPIEIPLTDTELNAYKKLHTNKPTTTILGEADMEVTYVADTKLYIDNKIAELTALTLEV